LSTIQRSGKADFSSFLLEMTFYAIRRLFEHSPLSPEWNVRSFREKGFPKQRNIKRAEAGYRKGRIGHKGRGYTF
jgi:hypothetical protein